MKMTESAKIALQYCIIDFNKEKVWLMSNVMNIKDKQAIPACRWLQVGSRNEPTWRRRGGDIDRLRNFDDQAELRAWYVETNPLLVCMFLFLCLRPVVRSPLVSAVWHCVIAKSMRLWLLFYSHQHIPTKWMPLHVCLFLFLCRRPVVRSPLVPPRRPVVRSPQVSAAAVWHCVIAISMRLWL